VSRHTAIAGAAYLRPFDVQGDVAVSAMWAQSFANLIPGVGARNQYGVETFWNIGVTPNSSLTPGIQFIFNPPLNPGSNFVAVPHVKFRIFFKGAPFKPSHEQVRDICAGPGRSSRWGR